MTALVIDDSRAMRMILQRILVEIGFDVTQACDGVEALERLDDTPGIEVALIDWNMPRMSGLEFVRAVRSRTELRDITLIMVTSETEQQKVVAAMASGANEYVMKPFTPEMIRSKLDLLGLRAR